MEENRLYQGRPKSFFDYLVLALKGFIMGASDVVPGVSGGTMAFILGIYVELVEAIKSFDLKSLQLLATLKVRLFLDRISWRFILALCIGIFTAILSLAEILSRLLENEPVLIWSFFLGLIFASGVSVGRRIKRWRVSTGLCFLAGMTATYFLVGLVPVSTSDAPWFLFFCGTIAICAMILPGISGSFILVLLGKYQYALDAVNHRDCLPLSLLAAGACVGIVAFSRTLGWLLREHHDPMVALLTGFMLGSLRKVWPFKGTLESLVDGKTVPILPPNILPTQWSMEVLASFSLMVLGLLTVLFLDWKSSKKQETT